MKNIIIVLVFISTNICVFSQTITNPSSQSNIQPQTTYTRPNTKERFKRYVKNTIGPTAFAGPVFSASWNQFRKNPDEWKRNPSGFTKRFGNSFGRNLINNTVTYGLDEALKLDSHFYKSPKRDIKSRIKNAVVSSFTARNEKGKRVLGVPRIVGSYSSAIIANEVWMPNRFSYKDGLRDGSLNLGMRVFINLAREFISRK